MLIVIAVLALVAGIVISRGPERSPALEARATAAQIAGRLRMARAQAIASDATVLFALDPARHLTAIGQDVQALPMRVALEITGPAVAGSRLPAIRFEGDGSSSGGSVLLDEGGHRLRIDVDWLTGRPRVQELPARDEAP